MKIETKFDRGQRVFITELDRYGIVRSIQVDDCGLMYLVRYFDNSEARTIWFYENELATEKPVTTTAFQTKA